MRRHRFPARYRGSTIYGLRRILSILTLICLALFPNVVCSPPVGCILWAQPVRSHVVSDNPTRPTEISDLKVGRSVQESIAGKQRYYYKIALIAGQFLRLSLRTVDSDAALTFSSPKGERLIELNTTDGPGGARPVFWIAQGSGDYLLEINSSEEAALTGKYSLELQEVRTVSPDDKVLVEAQTAFLEGEALRKAGSGDSLQAAIGKYQRAAELWKAGGQPAQRAEALNKIGSVYSALGQNNDALGPLNEALSIATAISDPPEESAALHNLGELYYSLGDKKKALSLFNQALLLRHSAGDAPQEADTLNDIGAVYDDLGRAQTALNYYSQALTLKHETGDRANEASILSNIGIVYDNLGENSVALEHYESAIAVQRALHQRKELGVALNNVGALYHHIGDDQRALDYYREALPLLQQTEARLEEGKTLSNMARSYATLGNNQDALKYFNRALPIREAVGDRRGLAYTLSYMGDTYLSMGDREKARDCLDRALLLAQQASAPSIESTTRYGIARLEDGLGDRFAAQTQMEKSLAIIEGLRGEVNNRELRSSYLATVQPAYEFYIGLLMSLDQQYSGQGYSAKALEAAERARARGLLDMLAEAQIDIRRGVDPQLLDQERNLQKLIDEKSDQEFRLRNRKHTKEQLAAIHRELEALLLEYEAVEGQIRVSSPRYAALPQPQPLGLADIQRLLDPETVLLEYSLGDKRSYVWVVTQNSLSSFELPARSEVESPARQLYALLTTRNRGGKHTAQEGSTAQIAADGSRYKQLTTELGRMVLGPVKGLTPAKRLVIVSDGALQYIPLGILPITGSPNVAGPSARSVSLIENHEIVNLPSASVLSALRHEELGRPAATKLVAVLADPVFDASDQRVMAKGTSGAKRPGAVHRARGDDSPPLSVLPPDSLLMRSASDVGLSKDVLRFERLSFTRQEAASIMSMVPAGTSLEALDFQASRATATDPALAQYRIVHFATHGLLDSEHPELSGLVFSLVDEAGRPQNGFVELEDIYNLNLHADLVVLSACETGLGKDIKGEGLVGLTRGFMYAGAPRVVASLWKVDDVATAELMRRFYKFMLQQDLPPAAALRAAQLEMAQQKRWSDPYYWAGFVVEGEWR